MVSQTAELPNLRRLFLPDPDHVLVEVDLEKADAQVVAWDAGAKRLKQIFREGLNLHAENAVEIFKCKRSEVKLGGSNSPYQRAKIGVHAVDYACKAKTLAAHINSTVHEADLFIKRWFSMNPEIPIWQEQVWSRLTVEHKVTNKFGFRIYYFDRVDRKLLGEALAWIASSTVSHVINRGLINVYKNVKEAQLLLQIHDSFLLQTHKNNIPSIYPKLKNNTLITVPYDDPLIIPINITSSDKSWGDMEEVDLVNAEDST